MGGLAVRRSAIWPEGTGAPVKETRHKVTQKAMAARIAELEADVVRLDGVLAALLARIQELARVVAVLAVQP